MGVRVGIDTRPHPALRSASTPLGCASRGCAMVLNVAMKTALFVQAATGAAASRVARDFPMINDVVLALCGDSGHEHSTGTESAIVMGAQNCRAASLGFAMAYSECQRLHPMEEGREENATAAILLCVDGCATEELCAQGCTDGGPNCPAACSVVSSCVGSTIRQSSGAVSAESYLRECLEQGLPAATA